MAKNCPFNWVGYIDQALKIYLNRKHRKIEMSPIEGDKEENEEKNIKNIFREI